MKNFERVTERDWNEAKFSFKTEQEKRVILHRCWELENDIELGKLDEEKEILKKLLAAEDVSSLNDDELAFFVEYNQRVRKETAKQILEKILFAFRNFDKESVIQTAETLLKQNEVESNESCF